MENAVRERSYTEESLSRIALDTDAFYVEKVVTRDGVPVPFSAHDQNHVGPGTMVRAHVHDYIELLYPVSGEFRILLGSRECGFQAGDMVIVNSNEIHHVDAIGAGLNQYIVVKFKPDLLYATAQSAFEFKYVMPFVLHEENHQNVFTRAEIEATDVPRIVRTILHECRDRAYGYELAVKANILALFLFILRSWNARNPDMTANGSIDRDLAARLSLVFDHVDAHYHEDLTTAEMAERCHLSYSYFSRLFKRTMRRSFTDYLNYVRIAKAERLLCTTAMNVTEIALATGFSASSYFIRQFERYRGISPKQYRKRFGA